MNKRSFYPGNHVSLSATRRGMPEGTQQLGAIRRVDDRRPCPKTGCEKYEHGWNIVLNLHDPDDANVARFIREGKTGRLYEETLLEGGVLTLHFLAGQPCLGHLVSGWSEPVYIAGDRKTVHDEWHNRYCEGAEALVAATTRLKEIREG